MAPKEGHPTDEVWSAPESGTVREDDPVDQSDRDDYDRPPVSRENQTPDKGRGQSDDVAVARDEQ